MIPRERLESLVRALKGRRLPDGSWMVHCPAHDDEEPSLHITPTGERLLLHCFAGCSWEEITSALQRLGLWDPKEIAVLKTIYYYEDEAGNVLFRKLRYEPKTFRIERKEGDFWRPGLGDTRRVLYRLPEVIRAKEVWIVEGEKDVETLRQFGVVATTNPNGASEAITNEYIDPLVGKDVVIIPDQDQPGKAHAAKWMEALRLVAKSVKIVDLPAKDVSEFLLNHSFEDLKKLVEETKPVFEESVSSIEFVPQYGGIKAKIPKTQLTFRVFPIRVTPESFIAEALILNPDGEAIWSTRKDWADDFDRRRTAINLEERFPLGIWSAFIETAYMHLKKHVSVVDQKRYESQWLCRPFIITNGVNILYGPMGHLKSFILEAAALSVAEGIAVLPGTEVFQQGRVLWLDFEGLGREVVMNRAIKILGREPTNFEAHSLGMPWDASYPTIIRLLDRFQPDLIIIDSLGPAVGSDLTLAGSAFSFFSAINSLSVPIAIVAHPPKNKPDSIFGSAFFGNLARNIWAIEKVAEHEASSFVTLFHEKFSLGPREQPFGLEIIFDDAANKVFFRLQRGALPTRSVSSGPTGVRILNYLKSCDGSAVTMKEIAKACELPLSLVRVSLAQLESIGMVTREGDKVSLAKAIKKRKSEDEDAYIPF